MRLAGKPFQVPHFNAPKQRVLTLQNTFKGRKARESNVGFNCLTSKLFQVAVLNIPKQSFKKYKTKTPT